MERYQNLGGDSGVSAYEFASDSITVQFHDGNIYRYSNNSAGSQNIETMKELAVAGQGLNSFISRYVRNRYESKSR
jgi:hypothetical protein